MSGRILSPDSLIKRALILSGFLLTALLLSSCRGEPLQKDGEKPLVVASLFPQYDFVRQIAGGEVDVELLLPPGSESHTFDPGPKDIERVYGADLFVYTGDYMEPWAGRIVSGAEGRVRIVNASSGIELAEAGHEDETGHDGHDHDGHAYDPHVWLDPTLAMVMVDNIADGLCEIIPDRAELFKNNAEEYKKKLNRLDEDTFETVKNGRRDTLCFAGRFAYYYFLRRYDLKYETAYESCSTEAEPSLRAITRICEFIKYNGIPCVYHEELADPKIAKAVAAETGASCELFSTGHSVSKDEFDSGVTFLDVMNGNLERIRKGLG